VRHTLNANDATKKTNLMARDYWLNTERKNATSIATSSFCAIHEITEPFYYTSNKRYDAAWAGAKARTKAAAVRKAGKNIQ
jgi:hypothetical protein